MTGYEVVTLEGIRDRASDSDYHKRRNKLKSTLPFSVHNKRQHVIHLIASWTETALISLDYINEIKFISEEIPQKKKKKENVLHWALINTLNLLVPFFFNT